MSFHYFSRYILSLRVNDTLPRGWGRDAPTTAAGTAALQKQSSKIGYRLQHAHYPAISCRGHYDQIMQGDLLLPDHLAAIEYLNFELGAVAQLHGVSVG